MKETRILSNSVSIRSDDNGESIVEGWGVVFNRESRLIAENGKVFYEIIRTGALDEALKRDDLDVIANRDHDDYKMLARTSSGTLALSVKDYGLQYVFTTPNTTLGNDTREMLLRGDLNESSFRYSVKESDIKWWRGDDGILRREILKIYRIFDVSIVNRGAFGGTGVTVDRGLTEFEAEEELKRQQELDAYYKSIRKEFYGNERND